MPLNLQYAFIGLKHRLRPGVGDRELWLGMRS